MISQPRIFTAQDIADVLSDDQENVCSTIAALLNDLKSELVGTYLQKLVAEAEEEVEGFHLKLYIESGKAAHDRRQEELEVQAHCY
jgi:hypothetical protein